MEEVLEREAVEDVLPYLERALKRYGRELRLPARGDLGSYLVDWVLARIAPDGTLSEFVALEVQTLDTTGPYRGQVEALKAGSRNPDGSQSGLHRENVNKRTLPQVIDKDPALRQEALCTKGLLFVCPTQVYARISNRLGNDIRPYSNQGVGLSRPSTNRPSLSPRRATCPNPACIRRRSKPPSDTGASERDAPT